MSIQRLISFSGIFTILLVAWLFSSHRKKVSLKTIFAGILIQLLMGIFVFITPIGVKVFSFLNDAVVHILNASYEGARFLFGPLAIPPGENGSFGFILIFQALPTIIFFSALMGALYYLRVMPFIIRQFSRLFTKLMGTSGAESLCAASNIFVGIEASTAILPYLKKMTRSELMAVLTTGIGTIASSMLGFYTIILHEQFPQIAGHLVSASLISAPASLLMAKVLLPETETPETLGTHLTDKSQSASNLMQAIIEGAMAGGKLIFGIAVLLVAFLGLVALINIGLSGTISMKLQDLLAYPFYPFALMIGVTPADAMEVARLLGSRVILTEVPAYQELARLIAEGVVQPRSGLLATYALCGFAHVSSVAIFVGGTAALIPERTKELASLAFRSLFAATLGCLMTAAVAGTFL
ncbi:MAG: nucleoside transporter [Deltaproteobacteria bacterium]|nr:nucleoside transporter [Deltaproteobacteria bacterium]